MDDVDSFNQQDYGDLVLPTVATASTVAAGWFVLRFLWKMYQLSPIPQSPTSSLLFGNLLDALGQVTTWHETGTFPEPFLGWAIKYGNAVRFREMLDYSVMFTDPKAIQHLFSTNGSNYHRTPLVENFLADFTFGPGLLSTRGAVHDGYRKMLNPLFSAGQIKKFVPIFEAQARHACDTVFAQAVASGDPIDLYTVFSDLTLRVIGLAGFGFNFAEHPEVHQAYEMVHQDEVTPFMLVGLNMVPGFFDFPLPGFISRRKAQVSHSATCCQ
ncbi:cytochrome P450-dit2 [Aphanomyces cochlioides]|nr:cytochrome P450-dit2 [Aphanomyces cochlioides]